MAHGHLLFKDYRAMSENPVETSLLETLAQKLEHLLTKPEDKDIWSEDDICKYLSLGKSTISRKVVAHPNFPAPVIGKDFSSKRWFRADVIRFLNRYRGSL